LDESGKFIYGKNTDVAREIASLTKIMTFYAVLKFI